MRSHAVLIATSGRSNLLKRALESVSRQSAKPDRIVIVLDSQELKIEDIVLIGDEVSLSIEVLRNRRTKGASGAWNTGLDHLTRDTENPSNLIVSILDDDDWWDREYLFQVRKAFDADIEVIAATLRRHDETSPEGRLVQPPSRLSAHDFLVGNPGIQGSNLSARLSTLLRAGLFDEALASCTDRDLCIRFADLHASFRTAPLAVAHHDCLHGQLRLSDPCGSAKQQGLEIFHAKWHRRMTHAECTASIERASSLFGWAPSPTPQVISVPSQSTPLPSKLPEPLHIVVGIIVDGDKPQRCLPLIDGLARLHKHSPIRSLDVILLENGEEDGFSTVTAHARGQGLGTWPVRMKDQLEAVCAMPSIQPQDISRRKPIAIARTLLQRFVYEVSHLNHDAPVWILDDDFRLPPNLEELVQAMAACRDHGIDVAIGGNSGAAPVPASSLIRTQLVDIASLLISATAKSPGDPFPDAEAANREWAHGRRDAHYDLSRRESDRLETPFLPVLTVSTLKEEVDHVLKQAERIFAGEAITRPVTESKSCDPASAPNSCLRGGNTFVTTPTLLRDIPNMAPRINGRPTRRSDMIWAATALHRFGKRVKSFRLPMHHDRSSERTDEDDSQRLIDDIIGYGFFSAYEEVLRGFAHPASLTDVEKQEIVRLTNKYSLERLAAYRLSFWRINGLNDVIKHLLENNPWWHANMDSETRAAFGRFRDLLAQAADLERLNHIEKSVRAGLEIGEFAAFLSEMDRVGPTDDMSEDGYFRAWLNGGREARARLLIAARLGHEDLTLLGMGHEGVVLRAGSRVVKVFDRWTSSERQDSVPTLVELINSPAIDALPKLISGHDWDDFFTLEYEFEPSSAYTGGSGTELIAMLRHLRRCGLVHTNICPKNLRVTAYGLQLIDVGKSLAPATAEAEERMVRRAFLSWRFAGRENLPALMRTAMTTEALPELTGWRALFDAVTMLPSKQRLDTFILDRIHVINPQTLLDYGCGKPRALDKWASERLATAFDPDPALRVRWQQSAPQIRFWEETGLAAGLAARERFDVIVCSLVLCAVDDTEADNILQNLRCLVDENGRVIVAVCDPVAVHIAEAVDQIRQNTQGIDPALPSRYLKHVVGSANSRLEFHRSVEAYRRAFARAALRVAAQHSIDGFDGQRLERIPEFLVFELTPLPILPARTSLLIKLCAMEAQSALHQVHHLVRQLARPRAFDEVVLLVDPHEGPFPRAYASADLPGLRRAIARLQAEGVVDRVIDGFIDGAAAAEAARRWTGCDAEHAHCANGQPVTAILAAMEACTGDYIFHADADVLIARPDPDFDHIADAIRTMEENPDAVTLSIPVYGDIDPTPRRSNVDGPYRVETMCGWVNKQRLMALRPLPGRAEQSRLNLPWHRMVDLAVRGGRASSLRCGSQALWFVALDNLRKIDGNTMELVMNRVEAGFAHPLQTGRPLLTGTLSQWLGPKRPEGMVLVICGRNVRPGAVRRCFDSLRAQSHQSWGAIVIDDASAEPCRETVRRECAQFGNRITLIHRYGRAGLLPNTALAIRDLVQAPDAVIVLLDLDDALAIPDALSIVAAAYREGADLTVGSMLRTDKEASYPVDFTDPRAQRGGNVWQHLRTFRKSLFDRIKPADLKLDGEWIDLANDWAYMLPLVEMAKNPVWIKQPLYLHEPSTTRPVEEKAAREEVISRIVAKPTYRARSTSKPQPTILRYHRFIEQVPASGPEALFHRQGMAVTTATFKEQLSQALRKFEPVRLEDVLAAHRGDKTLPEHALLITVDDGYRDFASLGLPILLRAGIEPVLFPRLPTPDGLPSWAPLDLLYLGRGLNGEAAPFPDPCWRSRLLDMPLGQQLVEVEKAIGMKAADLLAARKTIYLSESELRTLPGVALGCHGTEHIRWTNLADAELDQVLARCRSWLADMQVSAFVAAYPHGAVDQRVAARLQQHGFEAGFAITASADRIAPALAYNRIIMTDNPDQLAQSAFNDRENAA